MANQEAFEARSHMPTTSSQTSGSKVIAASPPDMNRTSSQSSTGFEDTYSDLESDEDNPTTSSGNMDPRIRPGMRFSDFPEDPVLSKYAAQHDRWLEEPKDRSNYDPLRHPTWHKTLGVNILYTKHPLISPDEMRQLIKNNRHALKGNNGSHSSEDEDSTSRPWEEVRPLRGILKRQDASSENTVAGSRKKKSVEFQTDTNEYYPSGWIQEGMLKRPADWNIGRTDPETHAETHSQVEQSSPQQQTAGQNEEGPLSAQVDGKHEVPMQKRKTRVRRRNRVRNSGGHDINHHDDHEGRFEHPPPSTSTTSGKRKRCSEDHDVATDMQDIKRNRLEQGLKSQSATTYRQQDPVASGPLPLTASQTRVSIEEATSIKERILKLRQELKELEDKLGDCENVEGVQIAVSSATQSSSTPSAIEEPHKLMPETEKPREPSNKTCSSAAAASVRPHESLHPDYSTVNGKPGEDSLPKSAIVATSEPSTESHDELNHHENPAKDAQSSLPNKVTEKCAEQDTSARKDAVISVAKPVTNEVGTQVGTDQKSRINEQNEPACVLQHDEQLDSGGETQKQAHAGHKEMSRASALVNKDKDDAAMVSKALESRNAKTIQGSSQLPPANGSLKKEDAGGNALATGAESRRTQSKAKSLQVDTGKVAKVRTGLSSDAHQSSIAEKSSLGKRKWGSDDDVSRMMQPTPKRRRTNVPSTQAKCSPFATEIFLQSSMTAT